MKLHLTTEKRALYLTLTPETLADAAEVVVIQETAREAKPVDMSLRINNAIEAAPIQLRLRIAEKEEHREYVRDSARALRETLIDTVANARKQADAVRELRCNIYNGVAIRDKDLLPIGEYLDEVAARLEPYVQSTD